MQRRLERKLFKTAYISQRVSLCVLCLTVCFCKRMCIYFHNTVAMRVGADVIQRIFSFAVLFFFSAQAPLQHHGRGRGPAETTTVSIHLSHINCLVTHCSPMLVCAYRACMCESVHAYVFYTGNRVFRPPGGVNI